MTEIEVKSCFENAFENIKDDITECKKEIVTLIEKFIEEEKEANKHLLIVNSPEARIKHKDQIWAKLNREKTIDCNSIQEDYDFSKHIRMSLRDLIGIRIICFFKKDEKIIFDKLHSFLDSNEPFNPYKDDIVDKGIKGTDRKEIHKVKIYKLQGKFTNSKKVQYCYEIQLKSMANDLWGEVDHEIVYKAKQYQYDDKDVREISNNIHDTLLASDKELKTLIEKKYYKEDLINSLFFLDTNEIVFPKGKFQINKIYHEFFDFYKDELSRKLIDDFVAKNILGNKTALHQYVYDPQNEIVLFMNDIIIKQFKREVCEILPIAKKIYIYNSDIDFYNHISSLLVKNLFQDIDIESDSVTESELDEIVEDLNEQIKHMSVKQKLISDYLDIFKVFSRSLCNDGKTCETIKSFQTSYLFLVKYLNKENF